MIVFSTRSCSATWHAGGPRDVFTRCPPRDVELLIGFAQLRNVWAVHKPLRSLVHCFHQIPKPSVFHGKILNIWIWNAIDIYIYHIYITYNASRHIRHTQTKAQWLQDLNFCQSLAVQEAEMSPMLQICLVEVEQQRQSWRNLFRSPVAPPSFHVKFGHLSVDDWTTQLNMSLKGNATGRSLERIPQSSPNQLPLIEKREVRSTFFHHESWILSMIWRWFDAISEANYSANWTWSLKGKSNRISHREPSHSGTLDLLWQSGRSQLPSRAAEQSFTSKTA